MDSCDIKTLEDCSSQDCNRPKFCVSEGMIFEDIVVC